MVGLINLLTAGAIFLLAFAPLEGSRFTAALILIVSGFGGLLAIYPAITAETFGVSSLGRNYGMIFAAYGLAAFIGPFISGHYSLRVILTGCAALALCASLVSFAAGSPRSKNRNHRNGLNSNPA
jgi:OFA family oxalate/formate antiporter-like MFS transporter